MKKIFSWSWKILAVIGALIAVSGFVQYARVCWLPPAKLIVSKETTWFTEPLREDGTVDFVAAINSYNSKGVTPENNGYVDCLRAIGPDERSEEQFSQLCVELGIEPLPYEGDYFLDFEDFLKKKYTPPIEETIHEDGSIEVVVSCAPPIVARELDLFQSKIANLDFSPIYDPWEESDFPLIAEWLKHNDSALDLVVAASQKTQWYKPVGFSVDDRNGRWSIHLYWSSTASVSQALNARAMLRLHRGETERSWHDLRTIGLLTKLSEKNFTPTIAHVVDDMLPHIITLTTDPRVKPEQRIKIFAELSEMLSSDHSVFDYIDTYARWNDLSMVTQMMEGDSSCLDPNLVLRMINEHYDQMVAIGEIKDPAEAQREVERIDQTVAEYSRISEWDIRLQGIIGSPQSISEIFAKKIIATTHMGWSFDREQQDTFVKEQCSLIAALIDYHDALGEYPPKLDDLVPEYIPALPVSPEGKQLGCEYKGRRFQLYFINK